MPERSDQLSRLLKVLRKNTLPTDVPLELQRETFKASVAKMEYVPVLREPVSISEIHGEILSPPYDTQDRAILYLHGSGYVMGSIDTVRPLTAQLAHATRSRVVSINYRLAPEDPFPAAVLDAAKALRWLMELTGDPMLTAVAGDSAGGGLALATLLMLRDLGEPLSGAAVCICPWVDLSLSGDSYDVDPEKEPLVTRERLEQDAALYLSGQDPRAPLASPLFADLSGLPPLLIHAGTADGLFHDALRLLESARTAGIDVTLACWADLFHVWHGFAPRLPEAVQAIDEIGSWLLTHLKPGSRSLST